MATEMNKTYNPSEIEDSLYQKWLDKKYFHAEVDETETIYDRDATSKYHRKASYGTCVR